jgi:hypothetical protein
MKTSFILSLLIPASVLVGCDVEENNDQMSEFDVADVESLQTQVEKLQSMVDELQARVAINEEGIGAIDYVSAEDLDEAGYLTGIDIDGLIDDKALQAALADYALTGDVDALSASLRTTNTEISDVIGTVSGLQDLVNTNGTAITAVETNVTAINDAGFLTSTDIVGYATEAFVTGQDFVTGSFITSQDYATEDFVTGQGYAAEIFVTGQGYATMTFITDQGYTTEDFVTGQNYATEDWILDRGYAEGLADYLFVDSADNALYFEGANLFVQSGSGFTDDDGVMTGLGNLIVGYDEDLSGADKSGSHNLVVGSDHSYAGYGGMVSGYNNLISGAYASVLGGSVQADNGLTIDDDSDDSSDDDGVIGDDSGDDDGVIGDDSGDDDGVIGDDSGDDDGVIGGDGDESGDEDPFGSL